VNRFSSGISIAIHSPKFIYPGQVAP
jgi:hypothetical protein